MAGKWLGQLLAERGLEVGPVSEARAVPPGFTQLLHLDE